MVSSLPGRLVLASHALLKMFDKIERLTTWMNFCRSQDEEARTARVIRKCTGLFNSFIAGLEVISETILFRKYCSKC